MMKLALIALPSEIRVFARCLSRIREIDWVGFGGYACTVPYISLGQGPESEKKVRYYASVDKLTDAADVLLVAGRQEDRFRYVSKALRKGKPVWAIGPVGRTWEETAKLASLAQEACVCNQAAHLARESGLVQAVLPYMTGVRLGSKNESPQYGLHGVCAGGSGGGYGIHVGGGSFSLGEQGS